MFIYYLTSGLILLLRFAIETRGRCLTPGNMSTEIYISAVPKGFFDVEMTTSECDGGGGQNRTAGTSSIAATDTGDLSEEPKLSRCSILLLL